MKKTLLHILMHNGRLLERAVEEELAPSDLHHGQGRILMQIKRAGKITQADLARQMDIKPATLTNMLKPLAQRNLITRAVDEKTNRAIHVSLTSSGLHACVSIQTAWDRIENRMLKILSNTNMDELLNPLEAIRNALGGKDPLKKK